MGVGRAREKYGKERKWAKWRDGGYRGKAKLAKIGENSRFEAKIWQSEAQSTESSNQGKIGKMRDNPGEPQTQKSQKMAKMTRVRAL